MHPCTGSYASTHEVYHVHTQHPLRLHSQHLPHPCSQDLPSPRSRSVAYARKIYPINTRNLIMSVRHVFCIHEQALTRSHTCSAKALIRSHTCSAKALTRSHTCNSNTVTYLQRIHVPDLPPLMLPALHGQPRGNPCL